MQSTAPLMAIATTRNPQVFKYAGRDEECLLKCQCRFLNRQYAPIEFCRPRQWRVFRHTIARSSRSLAGILPCAQLLQGHRPKDSIWPRTRFWSNRLLPECEERRLRRMYMLSGPSIRCIKFRLRPSSKQRYISKAEGRPRLPAITP